MKPEYANTFGLRKVADPQGQILEVTLDISYKYMENALTVTSNGLENVSTPNAAHVASIYEPAECHFSAQPPYPVPGGRDSLSRVERPEPFDGTTAIRPKGPQLRKKILKTGKLRRRGRVSSPPPFCTRKNILSGGA